MNTAGNSNPDLGESISCGQRCVLGLVRLLLPPHVDDEKAADHLRAHIGQEAAANLISDEATWSRWKGRMPVIYNKGFS